MNDDNDKTDSELLVIYFDEDGIEAVTQDFFHL